MEVYCHNHQKTPATLYCKKDKKFCCFECMDDHSEHPFISAKKILSSIDEKSKNEISYFKREKKGLLLLKNQVTIILDNLEKEINQIIKKYRVEKVKLFLQNVCDDADFPPVYWHSYWNSIACNSMDQIRKLLPYQDPTKTRYPKGTPILYKESSKGSSHIKSAIFTNYNTDPKNETIRMQCPPQQLETPDPWWLGPPVRTPIYEFEEDPPQQIFVPSVRPQIFVPSVRPQKINAPSVRSTPIYEPKFDISP